MSSHRQTLATATAIASALASTSLYPLFIGVTWFWAGIGATLTVALVGTLTRLRRLPVLVCLAVVAAGLLLYLNLAFEAGHSLGHLLPTGTSLGDLVSLTGQGTTDAGKYAPPAPELPGMLLLATGGIGIVAMLADFIAVRLRRVALAGLPLLLLITEPFAVSASHSWVGTLITFCLAATGYLAMLATEGRERIREWEQPRPGPGEGPDTSALSAAGRRVGIASVVVALIVPLLIPGLHTTRLFGGGPGIGGHGGSGGGGGGGIGFPSPETVMSSELQSAKPEPVLSYHSTSAEYFQVYVLDQLTDNGWRLVDTPSSDLSVGSLPAAPGLTSQLAGTTVTSTVQINTGVTATTMLGGKTTSVLPVPYPALKVSLPHGFWQASTADLMVYSTNTQLGGLKYSVSSLDLKPVTQDVEAAGAPDKTGQGFLPVPPSYNSLRSLARELTAGKPNAFDKALAIQSWLGSTGGFTYNLKTPAVTNARQLTAFLTSSKRGYCQQFAVAMAVLARLLGIPARVVVGFTSGTGQAGGNWLVTTHDAHEWPELYFTGFGWLRFEPTPTGTAGQGSATVPDYTKRPTTGVTGGGSAPTSTAPSASPRPSSTLKLPPGLQQPVGVTTGLPAKAKSAGLTPWEIAGLVVAGLLVIAVIAPSVARQSIRRRRWRQATRGGDAGLAHAAWRELQDDLIDYQGGYSPSESPRALNARVAAQLKAGAEAGRGAAVSTRAWSRDGSGLDEDPAAGERAGAVAGNGAGNGAGPGAGFWDGARSFEETGAFEGGASRGGTSVLTRESDVVDVGLADTARGELARASISRAGVAALGRITRAEERARYATSPVPGGKLRQDATAFRRALAATRPRRDRWRGRLLPMSVLNPTATGVSQAADVFSRVTIRKKASP